MTNHSQAVQTICYKGVPIFMRGSPALWYPFSLDTRSIATGTMYASSDYLQIHEIPGNKPYLIWWRGSPLEGNWGLACGRGKRGPKYSSYRIVECPLLRGFHIPYVHVCGNFYNNIMYLLLSNFYHAIFLELIIIAIAELYLATNVYLYNVPRNESIVIADWDWRSTSRRAPAKMRARAAH